MGGDYGDSRFPAGVRVPCVNGCPSYSIPQCGMTFPTFIIIPAALMVYGRTVAAANRTDHAEADGHGVIVPVCCMMGDDY
jgi:hypothetical protein